MPLSPQESIEEYQWEISGKHPTQGGGEGGEEWKLQQAGIVARGCRNSPCYFKNPT